MRGGAHVRLHDGLAPVPPRGVDPQQPHTRDEVYVVVGGTGVFLDGVERRSFAAGDLLFVPPTSKPT